MVDRAVAARRSRPPSSAPCASDWSAARAARAEAASLSAASRAAAACWRARLGGGDRLARLGERGFGLLRAACARPRERARPGRHRRRAPVICSASRAASASARASFGAGGVQRGGGDARLGLLGGLDGAGLAQSGFGGAGLVLELDGADVDRAAPALRLREPRGDRGQFLVEPGDRRRGVRAQRLLARAVGGEGARGARPARRSGGATPSRSARKRRQLVAELRCLLARALRPPCACRRARPPPDSARRRRRAAPRRPSRPRRRPPRLRPAPPRPPAAASRQRAKISRASAMRIWSESLR